MSRLSAPPPSCSSSCSDLAMAPFFGNSVACRIAEAHEINHSTLVLGDWRAAQRIEFYIGRNGEGVEWKPGGSGEEDEVMVVPPGLSPRGGSRRSRRNGGGSSRWRRNGIGGAGTDVAAGGVGGSRSEELLAAESGTPVSPSASEVGSDASTDGERSVVTGGLGGFKVYVVNAHLDHASAENRQRQVGLAVQMQLACCLLHWSAGCGLHACWCSRLGCM